MYYKQKKKMKFTGLLPAIISVLIFILSSIIWEISTGFYVLGYIILFYSLLIFYAYLRTKNSGTLISAAYMLIYGALLLSIAPHVIIGIKIEFPLEVKVLIVITILLFNWLLYLNFTRKLKWRGREILELAAQNVDDTKGSHTERPLPTGKVSFTKTELEDFAKYFEKNLLGLSYKETDRIIFMPLKYKNEYFALFNPNYNYREKTWVSINFNGNVSVNISKEYYLDYKEDLAFEQLCNSLNDVIIDFIKLFLSGSEVRIIDKMDTLKVNIFT
jgi:hypothetical protein